MSNPSTSAQATTLVDQLEGLARKRTHDTVITFIDEEGREQVMTYGALDRAAMRIAKDLTSIAQRGDRVLIAFDSGPECVASIWGAFYAGMVAVPADPPGAERPAMNLVRMRTSATDAQARVCLASRTTIDFIKQNPDNAEFVEGLTWLEVSWTPETPDEAARPFREEGRDGIPVRSPEKDIAALLYTSGATGTPKGTIVRYGFLSAYVRRRMENRRKAERHDLPQVDVEVHWLPMTHTSAFTVMFNSCIGEGPQSVWMTPRAIMQSPITWLRTIARQKPGLTVSSVAPNFALDWCVSSIGEEERKRLDLRGLRLLTSVGERIRPETLRAFTEAFKVSGLRSLVVLALYGTTETGIIAAAANGRSVKFDRASLDAGVLKEAPDGAVELQSSGTPMPGVTVRIVNPETKEPLPDGQTGEIWVQNRTTMASGYWNSEEGDSPEFRASTASGDGPFFRTGDIGAYFGGELFITGRLKQLIIVRGQKHYAEDIEATLELNLDWIRANSTIAFADDINGEQLLLAVEVSPSETDLEAKTDKIRSLIAENFGVRVSEVLFVAKGNLPSTSIGKVSRGACRQLFRDDRLPILARHGATATLQASVLDVPFASVTDEADAKRRTERMADCLRTLVAGSLMIPAAELSSTKSFRELGMDSASGVRFRSLLSSWVGRQLPSAVLYNYPSVEALSRYLAGGTQAVKTAATHEVSKRGALGSLKIDEMSDEAAAATLEAYLDETESVS